MLKFLGQKLRGLLGRGKIDEKSLEELEKLFYEADLGASRSAALAEHVRKLYRKNPSISTEEVFEQIKKVLLAEIDSPPLAKKEISSPQVVLIVGVNGNGKTTTIAKLAYRAKKEGKRVLIGAADTFRAAAIDQLEKWAEMIDVPLVRGKPGSDAAAVAFDAIEAAKSRGCDVVFIDTAGRLHTKGDLMQELEKIRRVCGKAHAEAPHETWLILDATIGQNGIEQAKAFHGFTPLTGLVLTKMDGTAKGGAAISIQKELGLPICYIGTGERVEALEPFDPNAYVEALLSAT